MQVFAALLLVLLAATTALAGFHGTFNGASCYSAPSSASLETITAQITVEFWVYPLTGGPTHQGVVGTWDDIFGQKRSWGLRLDSRKPVAYTTDLPTTSPHTLAASSAIPENQWTHVAFTMTASGTSTMYVDGVAVATGSTPASPLINVNGEPMRIGCALSGGAPVKYLTGYLDNVRVWNVARDVTQVQAGMNSCGAPSGTGLVAQYNFDEGTGTSLGDTSGNGNNAVVSHGAPAWGTGNPPSLLCATHDPSAFCDNIASQCTLISDECTTIRNGGHTAIADDCDTSVSACQAVESECRETAANCLIV